MNNFAVSDSESSDDAGDEADIYEIDPNSSEGAREARAARAARRAGIKTPTIGTGNHFHYFAENTMKSKLVHRPRFLVCGKRGMGQSTHVSPAILHSMEHIPVHCLDLPALFGCASKTAEEACSQVRILICIVFTVSQVNQPGPSQGFLHDMRSPIRFLLWCM